MRKNRFLAVFGASLVAMLLGAGVHAGSAAAQGSPALNGQVSSAEEGAMEGVVVSAKPDGGTITVSVVSDDKGHYSFPAARLAPGPYAITIRAVGYDLDGPGAAEVAAGKTASADLKLKKTKNLAGQLSNAEWLASMPGTDRQKSMFIECVGCHTLQRILRSTHDAAEFEQIFARMGRYAPGSMPSHPQLLLPGPRGERPAINPAIAKEAADYLASVNLSTKASWDFPFKTLPRPKGRATHVIVTEYDLPREDAMPHDVTLDKDGTPWYSDFGAQFIGALDPKTGKVTDYKLPEIKPGSPLGTLDLESDRDGNLWVSMMYQGGIARFDRRAKKFQVFPIPAEWQSPSTQESMVSPNYAHVDGKVWTNNQEMHAVYRLDLATGKYENLGATKDATTGKPVPAYGMPPDLENNLYLLEFSGTEIGKLDAKTGKVTAYPTPFPGSKPRRGRVDAQDRLWFAEYGGNAIAMFDPEAQTIKEWQLPSKWSDPYDVAPDNNTGEVWTGSMMSDQIDRLDPKTGDIIEYLLPRETNIRRVFIDSASNTLWVGSNHGASIVKVEPTD
jgi:virginiamycin B lyase